MSGVLKFLYKSTIISDIPNSAGAIFLLSTFKPKFLLIEDWILSLSKYSPSISDVLRASLDSISIINCSFSFSLTCLKAPRTVPVFWENFSSKAF
nr:hypothetical protein [Algibacter lectus]